MESSNFSEPQQLFQEQCVRRPIASTIIRGACWHLLHLVIATFLIIQDMIYHLISSGVRYDYQHYRPVNLKYLAIVFDTKSVKLTGKIVELLDWLSCIGVQNLILYDSEGILKKLVPVLKRGINSNSITFCDNDLKDLNTISGRETLSIEVLSYSDNKEAVAKAASYLCANTIHGERPTEDDTRSPFDEADVGKALEAVGCGGPAPDLLLVFGGARCHFGFPAWRLRYTEIVHAGPLESLNYGAILKAFHRFSITRQNYGLPSSSYTCGPVSLPDTHTCLEMILLKWHEGHPPASGSQGYPIAPTNPASHPRHTSQAPHRRAPHRRASVATTSCFSLLRMLLV